MRTVSKLRSETRLMLLERKEGWSQLKSDGEHRGPLHLGHPGSTVAVRHFVKALNAHLPSQSAPPSVHDILTATPLFFLPHGKALSYLLVTFPMPAGGASTSLSITNPLVLYRALVATHKIKADPAQHRLALHLQKLYFRLLDYSPELEYRHRLDQIARTVFPAAASQKQDVSQQRPSPSSTSLFRSLFRSSSPSSILSLTRSTAIHDSAVNIDSPQGLLLYGEVGRGKSMLLDLLYSSLPSRKKRRWHFNTFMLDIFRRLEQERIFRLGSLGHLAVDQEHVVLSLAKDTVDTSPIIFLDEFQMPDRASSRLLNGFMTAFFHLGGVLGCK